MAPAQRAAHDRLHNDWRLLRVAWCDANGYLMSELIRAERKRYRVQYDYS